MLGGFDSERDLTVPHLGHDLTVSLGSTSTCSSVFSRVGGPVQHPEKMWLYVVVTVVTCAVPPSLLNLDKNLHDPK